MSFDRRRWPTLRQSSTRVDLTRSSRKGKHSGFRNLDDGGANQELSSFLKKKDNVEDSLVWFSVVYV